MQARVPLLKGVSMKDVKVLEAHIEELEKRLKTVEQEKREIEQKFKLGQFYFENVLNRIPGSVYWKDLDGRYLGCNQYMADMVGLKGGHDVIGKTDSDLVWKENAEALQAVDQEVMISGKDITLEEVGRLANGIVATYLTTKTPLRDDKGKIIGVLGVSMEITKHKQLVSQLVTAKSKAEASQHSTERFLHEIIANLPCHVYWKDVHGVIIGCNDLQAKSAGFKDASELIGKTDYEAPWSAHADMIRENDLEIMRTGVPKTIEEPSLLADGNLAVFLSNKVPLYGDSDKVIGVLGISVNITERKKMEEALVQAKEKAEISNQTKSRFLASMAHDLRTPLNGLYGMTQILYEKVKDLDSDFIFENIKKSKDTLIRLIDDILSYAKLEAGKFELITEAFNLRQVIEEVVMMTTHQANQKNIQLVTNYPDMLPRYLTSDPHCLRRILINLISNAIKFTEKGHVWVAVDAIEKKKTQVILQIKVEDSGIGIPADKLDFIFERFGRIKGSYESSHQGTGLGLAIVKEIVEKLGGKIHVESELNKGSAFICTLPFKLQSVKERSSLWKRHYKNVRILVVDESQRSGQVILEQVGSEDGDVVSGKDALDKLKQAEKEGNPYEVVIIDDAVDHIKPLQLAKNIKEQSVAYQPMLVFLAKSLTLAKSEAAKKVGYFAILVKPMQPTEWPNELTRYWQRWLNQQSDIEQRIKEHMPNVLVIEDDLISRHFAVSMLTTLGCQVDVAKSGEEALLLLEKDYDIIFSDIGLPDFNGIELSKQIREFEGDDYLTPIIALTGHMDETEKDKCLNAGMNDFLVKPVTKEQLVEAIGKWVLGEKQVEENASTIFR